MPFGLREGSQFRLPAPPALQTGKYANDYNEVKLLGRFDSPFRPQDRTDVARFYAVTSPVNVFNSGARQVSAAQGKTLSENARIFALLAMAIADAQIAVYDTKYHYNFWRPWSAIQAGDLDGNPLTDPDPDWLPLIATPPHPSYASGHATSSGAARAVLERVFGKDGHAITLRACL
jgi:membrane-associated phospholipid phosphatase